MKNSDKMVLLMSSLINLDVGTKTIKRQLIAALYKIAKKGIIINHYFIIIDNKVSIQFQKNCPILSYGIIFCNISNPMKNTPRNAYICQLLKYTLY